MGAPGVLDGGAGGRLDEDMGSDRAGDMSMKMLKEILAGVLAALRVGGVRGWIRGARNEKPGGREES